MNKCNVPKKVNNSNSEFLQDTVIVYKKKDDWYIELQRMTKSEKNENEWQETMFMLTFNFFCYLVLSVTINTL